MKRLLLVGLAVLALAAPAQAGIITTNDDLAGTWTGTFVISAQPSDAASASSTNFTHLSGFNLQGFTVGDDAILAINGGTTFNNFDITPKNFDRGTNTITGSFMSQSTPGYQVTYVFDVDYLGNHGAASGGSRDWTGSFSFNAAAVPEPGTMGFLAVLGATACFGAARRRRNKTKPADEETAA